MSTKQEIIDSDDIDTINSDPPNSDPPNSDINPIPKSKSDSDITHKSGDKSKLKISKKTQIHNTQSNDILSQQKNTPISIEKNIKVIKKQNKNKKDINHNKETIVKDDTVTVVNDNEIETTIKDNTKEIVVKDTVKAKEQNKEILLDIKKKDISISNKKNVIKKNAISNELFNGDDIDYRTILTNYDFTKNVTRPRITKYEKALLIGKRAKQIEEGANPNVKVLYGQSAIEIAEEELRQRVLPLIIKRPNGNSYEYWRLKDMEVNMD